MNSFEIEIPARFSSAHLYHQKAWSEERNRREFGRCFTEHGHGHNYELLVRFEVPANPDPELIARLRRVVSQETQKLDHEHLNFVVPEFRDLIPTTENIALYLRDKITAHPLPAPWRGLRLHEMPDLWVEVTA
ncbi:MAG: 6-carboxytetrahydropterin synthase [Bdellovibrionaceae bacterium]|nr:6-carboxytetrahydropterin synthase [Pseudobdellovibrionaceae bacterium]MBX3034286.1 6-carboxytetrahydropterin synthase [Pseudobdellovibrionaceae bacterium]